MQEIAADVYLLAGWPRNGINVYVMDGFLVDAGTRHASRRILDQVRGRPLAGHVLTHVHPDHQGASHAVCAALGLPLWCGARDADGMEAGDLSQLIPQNSLTRLQKRFWTGPAHPVARRLGEGDTVGSFTVVDAPGHSPGHVAFWRERDRVLILGDVLTNMSLLTGKAGLHEPPRRFTVDPAANRQSARKLAALDPAVVCFGHGPPLRDGAALGAFADRLRR
ncbi:MAG TPA: MBL fold metallo-hydrolase [Herpetosiphonaceae bacterium]